MPPLIKINGFTPPPPNVFGSVAPDPFIKQEECSLPKAAGWTAAEESLRQEKSSAVIVDEDQSQINGIGRPRPLLGATGATPSNRYLDHCACALRTRAQPAVSKFTADQRPER